MEVVLGDLLELRQIPQVKKSLDTQDKPCVDVVRDQPEDISLDVLVFMASDLFQRSNPRGEVVIATAWLEECKPKVQFVITYSLDNPFHIVVPEHFVKVVKNFDGEDLIVIVMTFWYVFGTDLVFLNFFEPLFFTWD